MSQPARAAPGEAPAIAVGLVSYLGWYIIGERPRDATLGGYWEFPGGKCLPSERPEECVLRECREETGLEVCVVRLRQELIHAYPHGTVRLFFFDCQLAQHIPSGLELPTLRPPFRWVPVAELGLYRFLEANTRVIRELTRC